MFPIIDYTKAMPGGMNRDWRVRSNASSFESIKGLKATTAGLKAYDPFTTIRAGTYPAPDVFVGKRVVLAFHSTSVYDIANTASVTIYDFATYAHALDTAGAGTITAGGQWHFLDSYDTWMAFNGSCIVFKTAFSAKVFVADYTTILTGCNLHEGRSMIAGFDSTDAIWTELGALFEATQAELPDALQNQYAGLDATWVMWTSIGGVELLGLLEANFLKYGWFDNTTSTGYTDSDPLLLSLLQRAEFGARPLLQSTAVVKCMSMGAASIVYQVGGHTAMWPVMEPVPTFGIVNPSTGNIGIDGLPQYVGPADRGCVGGNNNIHLMLDEDGDLWTIEKPGKAQRHKASHLLKNLLPSSVRISMDEAKGDFYIAGTIAGALTSFCLSTTGGLTRSPYASPNISNYGGVQGSWTATTDGANINVITMPFSCGHPEIGGRHGDVGVLREVLIATVGPGWKAKGHFRWNQTDDWTVGAEQLFDDRGRAQIDLAGIEWKVEVYNTNRLQTEGLDALQVGVQVGGTITSRALITASAPSAMPLAAP